jgi:hypothetical protein
MKYLITESQYRLLNEETEEILELSFKMFNNDWNFLQEYLNMLGNPPYKIIGNLDLAWYNVKSLGRLMSVDGYLNLYNTNIESLGNLESVGGYLYLYGVNITSLGNLKSVGGDLELAKTNITSLGNLKYVGGDLDLTNTPLSLKTITEDEIISQVKVGGKIRL